jgi:hypothetical protein
VWVKPLFTTAALAALGALAACSPPPSGSTPAPAAVEKMGEVRELERALPAPGAAPRYVGLWAAAAEGCDDPAWRFEPRRLTTKGEVSCTFNDVSAIPGGYAIAAACTAEAPPAPARLQLSFSEAASAMLISGGLWDRPIGLVYCRALAP